MMNTLRSPVPHDPLDSLESSYSHRKLRSSLRERPSPPPPPPTMDKAVQCEIKKCRKTVQEAARSTPGTNKVLTKREYSDGKWAYSDKERKAQQSALATAYPNTDQLPAENILDDRPSALQFQYSKFTKHVPVSSLEQQVTNKRKVTTDYDHDLKFRLYAYKPGMDGKRSMTDNNNNNNHHHHHYHQNSTLNKPPYHRSGEVIYSQVDVSKKRSPKSNYTTNAESPLPDYSDYEPRSITDRELATRPYMISSNGINASTNLRSRSASPARQPLSNHHHVNGSNERMRTYQFGFQSAMTQPPPAAPVSLSSTSSLATTNNRSKINRSVDRSDSKIWPDSAPLPSSSQPAPLSSGTLLRQLSNDQKRTQSSTNPQVTYATLERHRTTDRTTDRIVDRTTDRTTGRPLASNLDERTAYTLDRKYLANRSASNHVSMTGSALNQRSYALNRNNVSSSCNDLLQPPAHIAPSPPPPPPPPQFSDANNSLSRHHQQESDYLQPRRCGSRLSIAYGNAYGSTSAIGSSSLQRRTQSMNRSPVASVRKPPVSASPSHRCPVARSASMNSSIVRPINRTSSPSYSTHRLPVESRPISRSSSRSQPRYDQPIVVQLPPASALAHSRRLSASLAGGLNQVSNHSSSLVNRPSALYRSSEQVNRLANRLGSSMSINQPSSTGKLASGTKSALKSTGKPPVGFASSSASNGPLASSSSHLKRAQSIPKNAKLPLLQKLKNKLGKSSKD